MLSSSLLDAVAYFYQTLYCSTSLSPRQWQFPFKECKRTTRKFTQLWLMADACHCCALVMVEAVGDGAMAAPVDWGWFLGWCIFNVPAILPLHTFEEYSQKTVCIVVRPIKSTLFEKFFETKSLPNAAAAAAGAAIIVIIFELEEVSKCVKSSLSTSIPI